MPTLRYISCTIEVGLSNTPLPEYGTTYHDGRVDTYIPVPSYTSAFSIHLTTEEYIAPGLAMFAFIDGVQQCMRHQVGLDMETQADLRVRQKEDKLDGDVWLGRDWRFERIGSGDKDSTVSEPHQLVAEKIGTIEVVVLRCYGEHGYNVPSERSRATKDGALLKEANATPAEESQFSTELPLAFGLDGSQEAGFVLEKVGSGVYQGSAGDTSVKTKEHDKQGEEHPAETNIESHKGTENPISSTVKPVQRSWRSHTGQETHPNRGARDPYVLPALPQPPISSSIIKERQLTHRVRIGQAATYWHTSGTPLYRDTMEKPYATFVFKYRARNTIRELLKNTEIEIPAPDAEVTKRQMVTEMTKEELVEALVRARKRAGYSADSDVSSSSSNSGSRSPASRGRKKANSWSKPRSKAGSEHNHETQADAQPGWGPVVQENNHQTENAASNDNWQKASSPEPKQDDGWVVTGGGAADPTSNEQQQGGATEPQW